LAHGNEKAHGILAIFGSCSNLDSRSDVKITLSDADAGKTNTSIKEGEIATNGGATADTESRENLANVDAYPNELVKSSTCFLGWSLMTQAELDGMVSDGYFSCGDCRLPSREMTSKPKPNESVVFHNFFTASLRFPVLKRFVEILAAYNVQIHQVTSNSIPQILKFLWSCCTSGRTNKVDTFVRHFEIH
jgi:hypothetical protein